MIHLALGSCCVLGSAFSSSQRLEQLERSVEMASLSCCGNVEQNKQEDRRLGIFSFRDHPPTPGPRHEVQGVSPKVRDSPSKGAASWQTLSLVLGEEASC